VRTLRDNAEDTHDEEQVWGVSAWAAEGVPLWKIVDEHVPHPQVRTVTVGELEDAGFKVERTGPPDHVTIQLRGELDPDDDSDLEALAALFSPASPRPSMNDEE
jgi:hypothetical protein